MSTISRSRYPWITLASAPEEGWGYGGAAQAVKVDEKVAQGPGRRLAQGRVRGSSEGERTAEGPPEVRAQPPEEQVQGLREHGGTSVCQHNRRRTSAGTAGAAFACTFASGAGAKSASTDELSLLRTTPCLEALPGLHVLRFTGQHRGTCFINARMHTLAHV